MLVKLPREVSGVELINVAKSAVAEIKDCEAETSELFRLEPGSIKKCLDKCEIVIHQIKRMWLLQIPIKTDLHFKLREIDTGQHYEEIEMKIYKEYDYIGEGRFFENIERNAYYFSKIEPLLERFWSSVFTKLSSRPV